MKQLTFDEERKSLNPLEFFVYNEQKSKYNKSKQGK